MTIKDILVGLAPRSNEDPGRDFAIAMAVKFQAQVAAIAYALEPPMPLGVFPAFTSDLLEQHRTEAKSETDRTRDRFVEAARRAGVQHDCHTARGTLQHAAADFGLRLRTADLAVLTQHQTDDIEHVGDVFAEAALFQSGRPMILVPRKHAAGFSMDRILIAWDASIHSARAVAAAMPLMSLAKEIQVFTVQEQSKGESLRANELARHLRLHNLNVTVAERNDRDVSAAIMKEVESYRASLVVMGGYGHSRFRELVFGGATRSMLRNMQAPVLMAH